MLILSILSATIFMGLYYLYTIKNPDNNWYNQFTGSYVFWFNRLPNKAIKWSLLICYIIYWITFLYLSGTYKSVSIIYSSILSAIVGFFIIKDTFLNRLHSSVLQISVWTGIIFVLVRCISGNSLVTLLSPEFYVWSFLIAVMLVHFDFTVHINADCLVTWRFYV